MFYLVLKVIGNWRQLCQTESWSKFSEVECRNEDKIVKDKRSLQMPYFEHTLQAVNLGWFLLSGLSHFKLSLASAAAGGESGTSTKQRKFFLHVQCRPILRSRLFFRVHDNNDEELNESPFLFSKGKVSNCSYVINWLCHKLYGIIFLF